MKKRFRAMLPHSTVDPWLRPLSWNMQPEEDVLQRAKRLLEQSAAIQQACADFYRREAEKEQARLRKAGLLLEARNQETRTS
ncbi:hypothetical protein [Deinococcus oregonensis]|uniref:hypothetical protein n=1 Tax=Deinococcus oregonensis TaxID=1805970 RepID=UPI0036D31B1B